MERKSISLTLFLMALIILSGLNFSIVLKRQALIIPDDLKTVNMTSIANAYASSTWDSYVGGLCGGVIHECPPHSVNCFGHDCKFYRADFCWAGCECHFTGYAQQDDISCYYPGYW